MMARRHFPRGRWVWENGMDARLQRMLDHFEIREMIEAYVHACDRSDLEGVKDIVVFDTYTGMTTHIRKEGKTEQASPVEIVLECGCRCTV